LYLSKKKFKCDRSRGKTLQNIRRVKSQFEAEGAS